VVIADPADNAGGGAPSDNTDILRHLIDAKAENAENGGTGKGPKAVNLSIG
jgi:microcystin degradation protein MlrC